jgi:hypothetical protein
MLAAPTSAAHEHQRASRPYLVDSVASNLVHLQQVRVEGAARLLVVHVEKTPVVRLACCHHYVVDCAWQGTKESLELGRVVGIERRSAQSFEFAGGVLKTLGIPGGEDQPGPFGARLPCGFEPDAGTAADYNDSLSLKFRFAPNRNSACRGAHDSPRSHDSGTHD